MDATPETPKPRRQGKLSRAGMLVVWSLVLIFFVWSFGGIYYFRYLPRVVAALLCLAYAALFVFLFRKQANKRRWLPMAIGGVIAVYLLSLIQQPAKERVWADDHARMPEISLTDDDVTIRNFRRFRYQSDVEYEANFDTLDFSFSQLNRVWFGVQRFTTLEGIAHTFLCFEIEDEAPRYFCVSVEVRREEGEGFSALKGMYRQYELIYVFSDERDEVVMRTVHRPTDRVYLYPVNATGEQVQNLFRDIAYRAERLRDEPEFYNSFFNNCTNNIAAHTSKLMPQPLNSLDPRLVIPGYSDRLALAKALIGEPDESFAELRERCRIDEVARTTGDAEDFSVQIRSGL